ncbi:hypothetical protein B0J18DRAFT_188435 [Chaetomium sp. MPI-SDFR-AT-0129]|nr:hypothetical protein B0J18DRAFT_188435 [Chaetomium sp. MPI-SDFR-AT-0129]
MGASKPILIMRVVGPGAPSGPWCWSRRRTHPFLRQAREVIVVLRKLHPIRRSFQVIVYVTVLFCVHNVELAEHAHCSDRPLSPPFRQAREGMDCSGSTSPVEVIFSDPWARIVNPSDTAMGPRHHCEQQLRSTTDNAIQFKLCLTGRKHVAKRGVLLAPELGKACILWGRALATSRQDVPFRRSGKGPAS